MDIYCKNDGTKRFQLMDTFLKEQGIGIRCVSPHSPEVREADDFAHSVCIECNPTGRNFKTCLADELLNQR